MPEMGILKTLFLVITCLYHVNCFFLRSKDILHGKRLINSDKFRTETNLCFIDCVKECIRARRCLSINYAVRIRVCELSYAAASVSSALLTDAYGYVTTDKADWSEVCTYLGQQFKHKINTFCFGVLLLRIQHGIGLFCHIQSTSDHLHFSFSP